MPETLALAGLTLTCLPAAPGAPVVWLPGGADELPAAADLPCSVIAVAVEDWDRDLSPWPAPAVFRGADFPGGAEAFLRRLAAAMPEAEAHLGEPPAWRGVAGYSLAGLFAVWAASATGLFRRAASVSGSLWYDGFTAWAAEHPIRAERVYLSVGDREKRTRDARMATVESAMLAAADLWRAQGAAVTTELNPGNHFREPGLRILKGLRALCA